MATQTIQDAFTDARDTLKDSVEPYRYPDDTLMRALNMCVASTYRLRPDMFILSEGVPSYTLTDLDDPFPLGIGFYQSVVYFIVGYSELRDDEYSDDSRANSLLKKYEFDLVGSRANVTA